MSREYIETTLKLYYIDPPEKLINDLSLATFDFDRGNTNHTFNIKLELGNVSQRQSMIISNIIEELIGCGVTLNKMETEND